jgi:hypothetical protein
MQVQREVEVEVEIERRRGCVPKYVFLDCRGVQGMDSSASAEFRKLKRYMEALRPLYQQNNRSCRWIARENLVLVFADLQRGLSKILINEGKSAASCDQNTRIFSAQESSPFTRKRSVETNTLRAWHSVILTEHSSGASIDCYTPARR